MNHYPNRVRSQLRAGLLQRRLPDSEQAAVEVYATSSTILNGSRIEEGEMSK